MTPNRGRSATDSSRTSSPSPPPPSSPTGWTPATPSRPWPASSWGATSCATPREFFPDQTRLALALPTRSELVPSARLVMAVEYRFATGGWPPSGSPPAAISADARRGCSPCPCPRESSGESSRRHLRRGWQPHRVMSSEAEEQDQPSPQESRSSGSHRRKQVLTVAPPIPQTWSGGQLSARNGLHRRAHQNTAWPRNVRMLQRSPSAHGDSGQSPRTLEKHWWKPRPELLAALSLGAPELAAVRVATRAIEAVLTGKQLRDSPPGHPRGRGRRKGPRDTPAPPAAPRPRDGQSSSMLPRQTHPLGHAAAYHGGAARPAADPAADGARAMHVLLALGSHALEATCLSIGHAALSRRTVPICATPSAGERATVMGATQPLDGDSIRRDLRNGKGGPREARCRLPALLARLGRDWLAARSWLPAGSLS